MPLSGSAFWALVVPVGDRVNLYERPSAERGTANVVTASSSIGSTAQYQQFGAWSYFMVPGVPTTAGGAFGSWSSGSGTAYTVSMYFRGVNGVPYRMGVVDAATMTTLKSGTLDITGGGTWHRYSVSYTENSTQNQRVYVAKRNSADTGTVYLDGFQVEAGSLTTYFDGDQEGCYWLGDPHASQSMRSGTYRGGGSVIALEDLGLKPDEHIGIGMPPQEITSQSYALQPGAEYQRSREGERPFVLTFKPILGTTTQDFHITRRDIINTIKPSLLNPQQPVRFWYTGAQGTVQIDAVYHSGLELGEMSGPMAEEGAVKFIAHDPYWYSTTQQGTSLAGQVNLGSTNYLAWRDPAGRWGTMGSGGTTIQVNNGLAPVVQAILPLPGTVLFGGSFGTVGGTVTQSIALWYQASNTFGTLTGGTLSRALNLTRVLDLARLPSGSIIVAGQYGTTAGTASGNLSQWNGAWGSLPGGTVDASVIALKYAFGSLFFGGAFSEVGGTAGARRIGFWANGSFGTMTGQSVGTLDNNVNALAVGYDRRVYMGGAFGSIAGTTGNNIGYWKDGTFGTMSSGITAPGGRSIQALATGLNGVVIGAGFFTNTSGGSCFNIFEWNGQQAFPLGSGLRLAGGGAYVAKLLVESPSGAVWATGRFGTAGNTLVTDGFAIWGGYAWLPPDIAVGGGTIHAVAQSVDGTSYIAGEFAGTAVAASVAQVVNSGMSDAYPVFRIRNTGAGTVRLYQLVNSSSGIGARIYFNTVLAAYEQATLVTEPGLRSFTGDGDYSRFGEIIPGSSLASFALAPGANTISLFCDSGSVQADLFWQPRHESVDGAFIP